MLSHFFERVHSFYRYLLDQRCLGPVCRRKIEHALIKLGGSDDRGSHGQGAGDGAQGAVEGKLAHEDCFPQLIVIGNLTRSGEQGDGDSQIKGGAFFSQVGRGQVDRNSLRRKFEAAVAHCGTNPLPGFPDRGVGKPDNVKSRHSPVDIYFYFQGNPFYPENCAGEYSGQHREPP